MLEALLAVPPKTLSPQSTSAPRLTARPATVDLTSVDQAIASFAGIYRARAGAIGSFKVIGKARLDSDAVLHTTNQPWEFQGWLPFASKRIAHLAGTFVEIELEVMTGEIHVGLLAEDGENLLGERYAAQAGNHQIQLPISSNEVKGVVFSTGPASTASSTFRITRSRVLELDLSAPAAASWQEALKRSTLQPPIEKNRWAEVEMTTALAVYRLMNQGEFHQARLLLHAADTTPDGSPQWFPCRLNEQLNDLLRFAARPGENLTTDQPENTLVAEIDHAGWPETLALRTVFDGMAICPLHREVMELACFLDLEASRGGWPYSLVWKRSALATTPVKRGILRQLFEVITNRVGEDSNGLTVSITTDEKGTRIKVTSDLRNGDLQYREFSADVAELQRCFNDRLTTAPHLVHNIGQENQLEIYWPDDLRGTAIETLSWERSPEDAIQLLHEGVTGGRTWRNGGMCYKTAPANTAKANTLSQEATLIRSLQDLEFLPRIAAQAEDPNGSAMSYEFLAGQTLVTWSQNAPTEAEIVWIIQSLSDAVSRLNQRGVQHRDLRAENVLVRPDLSITLIDFDQAELVANADDFGNEWDEARACAGFGGLIRQLGWEELYLRTAGSLALAWELGRQSAANSPGKHACYYRWQWGPLALTGERPWIERWQLFKSVFEGGEGTFLEIGCNLGLLSTYAAQHGWQAHGLDQDELAVAAADTIAATLGAPAKFSTADVTQEAEFAALDEIYGLVSALSVVHWLDDPAPIEAFLRRQPKLLFEGHRSFEEERDYLHSLDFPNVQLLGYSERLRPVLFASK